MLKQFFVALLLTLIAQQAHAFLSTEKTLNWLDKEGQEAAAARMYLSGMAEAFWMGSLAAQTMGKQAVICFPENQNLQTEELRLMAVLSLKKALNNFELNKDVKGKITFLNNPVSLSLQMVWQFEFPCD